MSATTDMLASTSTPDTVESRLGTLEFDDGAPSEATAALLYDHLDFVHGVEAFLGALPGGSLAAIRRGYASIGAEDNDFVLFPELMGSASVFLTGNCDTIYFWGFLDLSDGPMVIDVPSIEAPSGVLGSHRRHVVPVGHGLRAARPGPRPGRSLSHGGAWLRRAAARQRLPRLACSHDACERNRPGVHDRQRSNDPSRSGPDRLSVLSLRPGCARDRSRHVPCRRGAVGGGRSGAGDAFRRGDGQIVQHRLPE